MPDITPVVVRPSEARAGPPTAGMERRELFQRSGAWVGLLRTDAGVAGGWHHHGDNDSYIFILRGALTIDFGRDGRESLRAEAGDFIFNPANLVHRETTEPDADVEAIVVRIGEGPQLVNLDGPE